MTPALACEDITVTYGDVTALQAVDLAFEPGAIHAVVGQNGAGKTTFARTCAGIVRPTAGRLWIDGTPVAAGNVRAARLRGVELVHQSFALPPSFSVAEALEFGSRRRGGWLYTRHALVERWRAHLDSLDVHVRLSDRIRDLPVETQQAVEIARALSSDARVIILDEPTAVLSPAGIALLFTRLRRLQSAGVTVVIVLHKIREVLAIAETVSVLRAGRVVTAAMSAAALGPAGLAEAIVGSAVVASGPAPEISGPQRSGARPALELHSASSRSDSHGPGLDVLDLHVGRGEIVGIAGVEGNGQRNLVRAIAALTPLRDGTLWLDGHDVTLKPLAARRLSGLRIIPFERNTEGLSLQSALWPNWSARELAAGPLLRPIDPERLRTASRQAFERWGVRFRSVDQTAGALSGGNAQKVILAREIDDSATLIIAAQPTRGLDIDATAFVWRTLRAAAERGCGVLVISSDLDELFDISDRLTVLLAGQIVATFRPPYDLGSVGAAMTGANAAAIALANT